MAGTASNGTFCRLCGAWRGSYGLEPTIELYVEHTVAIFREVKRVLRADGVLFLNLGDSYASQGGPLKEGGGINDILGGKKETQDYNRSRQAPVGLKPKDLCGIPWRVALALQADGWWLRSDIIWAKPNPMPESCTDRPTTAHEHIFLLTKSSRYFYDAEAVREPQAQGTFDRYKPGEKIPTFNKMGGSGRKNQSFADATPVAILPNGRNLRSVWTIATAPFPSAHFATFPQAIPERCIKAGTSEKGCCPKCGAPWRRVVEKGELKEHPDRRGRKDRNKADFDGIDYAVRESTLGLVRETTTAGWFPTCTHMDFQNLEQHDRPFPEPIPCTVLDIFSGAGTTALVSAKLGRDAIGIELNPEYVEMSRKRIAGEMGMLCEVSIEPP